MQRRLKRKSKPHDSDDHAFKKGTHEPLIRISTDAFEPYAETIDYIFGQDAAYGQIVKQATKDGVETQKKVFSGAIEPKAITTSLIERSNLTIRTFAKRFMRRTLGFSKKLENLQAATAMHLAYYNYCWVVKTIKTTPAVKAGLAGKPMTVSNLYGELRASWPDLFWGVR